MCSSMMWSADMHFCNMSTWKPRRDCSVCFDAKAWLRSSFVTNRALNEDADRAASWMLLLRSLDDQVSSGSRSAPTQTAVQLLKSLDVAKFIAPPTECAWSWGFLRVLWSLLGRRHPERDKPLIMCLEDQVDEQCPCDARQRCTVF
jgi:hypothetical protein